MSTVGLYRLGSAPTSDDLEDEFVGKMQHVEITNSLEKRLQSGIGSGA